MRDPITPEFWHNQTIYAMRTFKVVLHEQQIIFSKINIIDDAGRYAKAFFTIAETEEDYSPEWTTTITQRNTEAFTEYCDAYNMRWEIGATGGGKLVITLSEKDSVCWPWFKEDDCKGCCGRDTCPQRAEWNREKEED